MKSTSRVCDVCGTVNQVGHIHCLACGQPLLMPGSSAALTSTPTIFFPPNKLLKQRYRAIHAVGKGGMGTVYIGQDTQLGNRLVAIKEMSQSGLSPLERFEAAKNFKREAHLLAGLQHPHLPSIYDHFEEDQRWYLVMSFVKGQTLTDYLDAKSGRLPLGEVLEIGIVLCNVLNYLHANRPPIIFRDLKPSNIMRTVDGHIYLIDFGVARFFRPGQVQDTANHGTSGYASPEQYGITQTTPRSDIYSLGATLYQMLSGYEPSDTPFLLPPLQWYVPTAPAALVTLITQMLDLDESKRPQSMGIVKRELQSISNSFNATSPLSTPVKPQSFDPTLPFLTPIKPQSFDPTPLSLRSIKRRNWLSASFIATGIVVVFIALYLIFLNLNAFNINTPYGVVNTFCNAMNSQAPDFQTAYNQLSGSYQRQHSLIDFQEYFQGTIQCTVASPPNGNNQAGLNLTLLCPRGPPPGGPSSGGPPPGGSPPPSKNPVDLTLTHDSSDGWKIDTIYLVGYICGFPPNSTPTN